MFLLLNDLACIFLQKASFTLSGVHMWDWRTGTKTTQPFKSHLWGLFHSKILVKRLLSCCMARNGLVILEGGHFLLPPGQFWPYAAVLGWAPWAFCCADSIWRAKENGHFTLQCSLCHWFLGNIIPKEKTWHAVYWELHVWHEFLKPALQLPKHGMESWLTCICERGWAAGSNQPGFSQLCSLASL